MDEADLNAQVFTSQEKPEKQHLQVFTAVYKQWASRSYVWRPPTDVFETDDAITVRVEIAGMRNAEFTISIEGRMLVIQGTRIDREAKHAFHQLEIRYGEFLCLVELTEAVVVEQIEADYEDGMLRVKLPKPRPQHIQVQE